MGTTTSEKIKAPTEAEKFGEFIGKWIVRLFFAGLFALGVAAMGSVIYAIGGWASVIIWLLALAMWEVVDISGKLGRIAISLEKIAKDKIQ